VMTEEERYEAVAACKWVDEVVKNAPYVTQLKVLEEHNVDFVVHGDDIVTNADGLDTYHEVKAAGKFKAVPRTVGISSTDIVGRMLLLTKTHFARPNVDGTLVSDGPLREMAQGHLPERSPYTGVSHFLPTSRSIVQFSERKEPKPTDTVIYIDGAFDLFHNGHIRILKKIRTLGDYVIVGLYDDQTVNALKGSNHPIMNLHERALSVLSCRYVDEVVIGAPLPVTKEMITDLKINLVVCGSISSDETLPEHYKAPAELGILRHVDSPSTLTTTDIIKRILKNRLEYEERNRKKEAKELAALHATNK